MYQEAKKLFARRISVSTATLQSVMKIPYRDARDILDRMIEEVFCEPQVGAWPCKVIRLVN